MFQKPSASRGPLTVAMAATILAFGVGSAWVVLQPPSAPSAAAPAPLLTAAVVTTPVALPAVAPGVSAVSPAAPEPTPAASAIASAVPALAALVASLPTPAPVLAPPVAPASAPAVPDVPPRREAGKPRKITERPALRDARPAREQAAKALELAHDREVAQEERAALARQGSQRARESVPLPAPAVVKAKSPPSVNQVESALPPLPVATPKPLEYVSPPAKAVAAAPLAQPPVVVAATNAMAWVKINDKRTITVKKGQELSGYGAYQGLDGKSAKFDSKTFSISTPTN